MIASLLASMVLTLDVDVRLSSGSFMGSVWAAPSYRAMVGRAEDGAVSGLEGHAFSVSPIYFLQGAPVLGPWALLAQGGTVAKADMGLLISAGILQAIGLSSLGYRLFQEAPKTGKADALVLEIAPVVANRLGLSLTLSGF